MAKLITLTPSEFKNIITECTKLALNKAKDFFYYPKYPIINEAKSYGGAFKVKNLGDIVSTKDKCLVSEGIDWDIPHADKGGIIVFSTDVNAVELSKNKLVNFIKQKFATFANRIGATKKIDTIANNHDLVGWTIGHYLDGRYRAKNGKNFGENSLSVELVGISEDKLIKIAEDICAVFQQECVLVKSYSTGRIMFVNPD